MSTETAPLEATIKPDTIREKTLAEYKFNTEEIGDLGKKLQAARRSQRQIEDQLDSIKADFKAKLSAVEIEQDTYGRKLEDGYEMREAFAIVTFNDPVKGRKTYRHEEGGEFIREDAMTHSDWQLPMFKTPDGNDATEPEATLPATTEGAEFLSTEGGGTKEDLGRILDVPGAGQTPLAAALDRAAAMKDAAQIILPSPLAGYAENPGGLRKAFKAAAKTAGWSEPQISLMIDLMMNADDQAAAIETLRPYVANPEGVSEA